MNDILEAQEFKKAFSGLRKQFTNSAKIISKLNQINSGKIKSIMDKENLANMTQMTELGSQITETLKQMTDFNKNNIEELSNTIESKINAVSKDQQSRIFSMNEALNDMFAKKGVQQDGGNVDDDNLFDQLIEEVFSSNDDISSDEFENVNSDKKLVQYGGKRNYLLYMKIHDKFFKERTKERTFKNDMANWEDVKEFTVHCLKHLIFKDKMYIEIILFKDIFKMITVRNHDCVARLLLHIISSDTADNKPSSNATLFIKYFVTSYMFYLYSYLVTLNLTAAKFINRFNNGKITTIGRYNEYIEEAQSENFKKGNVATLITKATEVLPTYEVKFFNNQPRLFVNPKSKSAPGEKLIFVEDKVLKDSFYGSEIWMFPIGTKFSERKQNAGDDIDTVEFPEYLEFD